VKLGTENRRNTILAAVLGVFALLAVVRVLIPATSPVASTSAGVAASATDASTKKAAKSAGTVAGKKQRAPESLDPTLNLHALAVTEQIKYEGSGRNIFVSQAEVVEIPKPLAPGQTDPQKAALYQPPAAAPPPPIPLKFFGFANQPGEPKKVFLSKGEDVFIAGEGEIVDRRYKVIRISPTMVDIQDVVGSGPPQSIPLTTG
jgi:hypothetical protein